MAKLPTEEPETLEIIYDNWEAYLSFLDCQTQWRVGGMGGLIGLDYNAVFKVLKFKPKEHREELFQSIKFIETGVLNEMSERRDDKKTN